jgi:hypothetical protein
MDILGSRRSFTELVRDAKIAELQTQLQYAQAIWGVEHDQTREIAIFLEGLKKERDASDPIAGYDRRSDRQAA